MAKLGRVAAFAALAVAALASQAAADVESHEVHCHIFGVEASAWMLG